MRTLTIIVLSFSLMFVTAGLTTAQSTRTRLAIMDFSPPGGGDVRGYGDASSGPWGDPGRMMAELLTTHFTKSGRFEVIERARLYQLLNERLINTKGLQLGEQATTIGRELGVQAIVVAGYQRGAYGFEVACRVISTADGSVLAAENILVPTDPNWMDQSLSVLATKLMAPWSKERGYVLDVFLEADKLPLLMIDLGTAQGARVGRKLEVMTSGDPIIHPVTRENLGTRDILLANAAIIQTQKEFSYARVLDRAGVVSTHVKMDDEGIDIGIERMQRVKLLDETTESADGDLSVLAMKTYLQITADIPEAKLLVDGKATPLNNNLASVRLGAGTHLIELQVGQMLLSREVTVTKAGARPKEIAFRKADLASAVAIKPPDTTPAEAHPDSRTVVTRTTPELLAEDRAADAKLTSLLPSPETMDEELKSARNENVMAAFEAGLRSLRYGYAKGNNSYLSIAADRFREVTRLSPDLALGHYNLGLALFYLSKMDEAQTAFQLAIKLDASLVDKLPLLWWEDFSVEPDAGRIQDRHRVKVIDGVFAVRAEGGGSAGLHLFDPASPWKARDVKARIRFRVVGGKPPLAALICGGARQGSQGNVDWACNAGTYWHLSIWHPPGRPQYEVAKAWVDLTPGWHVVEHTVVGETQSLILDGRLICRGTDSLSASWEGAYGLAFYTKDLTIEVDWVLITRP